MSEDVKVLFIERRMLIRETCKAGSRPHPCCVSSIRAYQIGTDPDQRLSNTCVSSL